MIETLFSAESFAAALRMTTPLLLVALGVAISLKAGIFNIAVEGNMLLAAFTGVIFTSLFDNWIIGVSLTIIISILLSLLYGFITIQMQADQIIAGLGVNILVSGLTAWILDAILFSPGGYTRPGLPRVLGFEDFGIWETFPILGRVLSTQNVISLIALILAVIAYLFVHRSKYGLRLRSIGEYPLAAKSLGINPIVWKYIALAISGFLCGLAGYALSMASLRMFTKGMTAGRGFIAFAAASFAQGNIPGTIIMSFCFALFSSVGIRMEGLGIPSRYLQTIPYIITIAALIINQIRKPKLIEN